MVVDLKRTDLKSCCEHLCFKSGLLDLDLVVLNPISESIEVIRLYASCQQAVDQGQNPVSEDPMLANRPNHGLLNQKATSLVKIKKH